MYTPRPQESLGTRLTELELPRDTVPLMASINYRIRPLQINSLFLIPPEPKNLMMRAGGWKWSFNHKVDGKWSSKS